MPKNLTLIFPIPLTRSCGRSACCQRSLIERARGGVLGIQCPLCSLRRVVPCPSVAAQPDEHAQEFSSKLFCSTSSATCPWAGLERPFSIHVFALTPDNLARDTQLVPGPDFRGESGRPEPVHCSGFLSVFWWTNGFGLCGGLNTLGRQM